MQRRMNRSLGPAHHSLCRRRLHRFSNKRASRMPSCPSLNPLAGDFLSAPPPRIRPSRSTPALLSRASVYTLQSLSADEMGQLFDRAAASALAGLSLTRRRESALCGVADGDARKLLNLLEQIRTAARATGRVKVDGDFVNATLAQLRQCFDKGGDAFYDQISALHKSVRGFRPRRRALLVLLHARWRCRPAPIWRGASCAWPGKTSGWPIRVRRDRHPRRRNLRAAWLAGGSWRWPMP